MYILGINGTPNLINENRYGIGESNYHDAAAALLSDGKIIAAYEEERLNRIKHTNKWPFLAINACLRANALLVEDIDYFSFNITERTLISVLGRLFAKEGMAVPAPVCYLQQLLEDQFKKRIEPGKIRLYGHHYAHAATAFYPSPFPESLVLTIDGVGEEYSGSIYYGHGNKLSLLQTFSEDQSLGNFYNIVTNILGFAPLFDEFKVMGLAPYGNPAVFGDIFKEFYTLLPGGNYILHNERLGNLLQMCPPRHTADGLAQVHKDIAASLQETLERIVFHVVSHYRNVTGSRNLCLAGGVALNCTMNGKLINSGLFEDVFVYPAANDSGLPVGSALAAYFDHNDQAERVPLHSLYLGSDLAESAEIEAELSCWKGLLCYERVEDPPGRAAELLAEDRVIGWVNGASEFAPRALGNRSILADSRPEKNKERINAMVKKREGFRPFAPSVLAEDADEYFELPANRKEFSHMTFVLNVREKYRQHLGAITHVDGTARVHTVSRDDNPAYWELINHFKNITNTPVVLNTSFNNDAEPIVDSVADAVVCFLTTNLDFLFVGDYLISRNGFSQDSLLKLYLSLASYVVLIRPEPERYELANTFNRKTWKIAAELWNILDKTPGDRRVEELFAGHRIQKERQAELLEQINYLWEKRLIRLTPGNQTNGDALTQ
jgi:carbamoyltransferase